MLSVKEILAAVIADSKETIPVVGDTAEPNNDKEELSPSVIDSLAKRY
jgi:hypothetical protein